jgi:hypothetical protein
MLRRGLLLGAVIGAVLAPSAHAAGPPNTFKVEATATATPPLVAAAPGDQMQLTAQCATADPTALSVPAYIYKCWVGPVYADTYCGFECFGPPFAAVTGTAPAAQYEFCVGAAAIGTTSKNFHHCVPLDPTSGTAVIQR